MIVLITIHNFCFLFLLLCFNTYGHFVLHKQYQYQSHLGEIRKQMNNLAFDAHDNLFFFLLFSVGLILLDETTSHNVSEV